MTHSRGLEGTAPMVIGTEGMSVFWHWRGGRGLRGGSEDVEAARRGPGLRCRLAPSTAVTALGPSLLLCTRRMRIPACGGVRVTGDHVFSKRNATATTIVISLFIQQN